MGKKKKEMVVLNQTELMPTTIGTVNTRQGSPIVVIVIILIFVVGIFSLDYIVAWLNPEGEIAPVIPNNPTPGTPTNPDNPSDQTVNQKYELTNDLSISIGTITFNSFVIDTSNNVIRFNVVTSGTSTLLATHNYYLEIYSSADILLQRIKLANDSIVQSNSYTYDITKALGEGGIAKLSILEIKDEDYNNIALTKKVDSLDALTCTLNNRTIDYLFSNSNNTYLLSKIVLKEKINETDDDYDDLLGKYETINKKYSSVDGITVNLNPSRGGFETNIEIDLNTINESTYSKDFNDLIYYKKGTEAKKIAFELTASSYNCK